MRKSYLTYLRLISMFGVIAIHVCISALHSFTINIIWVKTLYLSIRNIFHFAVPIFMMISGALLLSPEKDITLYKLFSKYIYRYGMVILVFGWIFSLAEEVFEYKCLSFKLLYISFFDMIQGKSWDHMWYMYMLFGMILILPILRKITNKDNFDNRNEIKYICITLFTFLSILPFITSLTGFSFGVEFPINSIYIFYMLIGYWIDTKIINLKLSISAIICILSSILIILFSFITAKDIFNMNIWMNYDSPLILIFSICFFMSIKHLTSNDKEIPKIIEKIEIYSFGVYIVHMFWINLIFKIAKWNPFSINALLGFIIIFFIVTIASLATCIIIKKVPFLNSIF